MIVLRPASCVPRPASRFPRPASRVPPIVATITRAELKEKIDRGDAFHLFEVLPLMYWRKHHLPGAVNLPPEDVQRLIPELVPDKRAEIVVYCWNFT